MGWRNTWKQGMHWCGRFHGLPTYNDKVLDNKDELTNTFSQR